MQARRSIRIVALLLAPAAARGEPPALSEGRTHYLEARFAEAESAFALAARDPSATRADLVEAWRHLAALAVSAGRDGEREAVRALSLDPSAGPPLGASPDVEALFERARARLGGRAIGAALELPETAPESGPVSLRVLVSNDPGEIASDAEAACGGPAANGSLARGPDWTSDVRLDVPAGRGPVRCAARVRTDTGVVVAEASGAAARASAAGGAAAGWRTEEGSSPWLWVALGTAVAAAVVVGVLALGDGDDDPTLGRPRVEDAD